MNNHENKTQRIESALSLTRMYPSISDIPDSELLAIGYRRTGENTIAPIEFDRQATVDLILREKNANTPFEPIELQLVGLEDRFQPLTEDRMHSIKNKLKVLRTCSKDVSFFDFEVLSENYKYVIPSQYAFHEFMGDFADYLKTTMNDESVHYILTTLFEILSLNLTVNKRLNEMFPSLYDLQAYIYRFDDEGVGITAQSDFLWHDLERKKSVIADDADIEREFVSLMESDLQPIEIDEVPYLVQLYNDFNENELINNLDIANFYISLFLEKNGIFEVAQKLRLCHSIEQTRDVLSSALKVQSDNSTLVKRRNELKALLNSDDVNIKQEYSGELKVIEQKIRRSKRILDGIHQYFSMPEYAVSFMSKTISNAQSMLVKEGSSEVLTLSLDPRYNKELDKDPGIVSGDCTAGNPLPFFDNKIPAYNVKVFLNERHIGNMYLLITTDTDGNVVWHFDAIQIPTLQLNWEMAIPEIVSAIGAQAEKKGVSFITVNEEPVQISNYDYIVEAVKKNSKGKIGVDMKTNLDWENVFSSISSFQGNGNALILWSKM